MAHSSGTFSSTNSFILLVAAPILLLLLAIIPGGRLAGEVEDKLAKVGQKVDEVGQGVGQVVDQLAKTETSQLWCPVPAVGTRCPAGSIFHFYRCCGQLNNECCMKLQTWASFYWLPLASFCQPSSFLLFFDAFFAAGNNPPQQKKKHYFFPSFPLSFLCFPLPVNFFPIFI